MARCDTLDAKRARPLIIAGPRQTQSRMHEISEALFPGMHVMQPKFPLEYIEMRVGQPNRVQDLVVTPQPARHTATTNPTALRVEVGGKIIAYAGDGECTQEMAQVGQDADLLTALLQVTCGYPTLPSFLWLVPCTSTVRTRDCKSKGK